MADQLRDQVLAAIAHRCLSVRTLETQRADSLDFHDIAVWNLKAALEAAFEAGRQLGDKTLPQQDVGLAVARMIVDARLPPLSPEMIEAFTADDGPTYSGNIERRGTP
jgi:hypothetical protein